MGVYIFEFKKCIKVGYTEDIKRRSKEIEREKKEEIQRLEWIPNATRKHEAELKNKLKEYRISGEYYRYSLDDAKEFIDEFELPKVVEYEYKNCLRSMLNMKRMSKSELSDKTKISVGVIRKYCNNTERHLKKSHLELFCDALKCELSDLEVLVNSDSKGKDGFIRLY